MSTQELTPEAVIISLQQQNYYQRLGLNSNDVSDATLGKAYRARQRMIQRCQPPLPAELRFTATKLVDQAFEVLSSPAYRTAYDRELAKQYRQPQSQPPRAVATDCSATKTTGPDPAPNAAAARVFSRRYQTQYVLHDGPRCIVYSGTDTDLNRAVVIKQMRPELLGKGQHREAFQREAELFANSNASNLVKILDFNPSLGALILEKMEGDLTHGIGPAGLPADQVRQILRDALSGLAALHDRGLTHGRIELRHLFRDDSGNVKLAVTPGLTGVTTTPTPSAETKHIAPELLNPRVFGPAGPATDIYAMGFVALELLCGESFAERVHPSLGNQTDQHKSWLLWHASPSEALPDLATMMPNAAPELQALLTRMTAKQQTDRPATARDCLRWLNQSLPQEVSPMSQGYTAADLEPTQVEVINGLPPSLHGEYQHEIQIQWHDVLRQPGLLLHPQARAKALAVMTGGVALLTFLLFFLSSSNPQAHLSDQTLSEQIAPLGIARLDHPVTDQADEPQDQDDAEPTAPEEEPADVSVPAVTVSVVEQPALQSSDEPEDAQASAAVVQVQPEIPLEQEDEEPEIYRPSPLPFEIVGFLDSLQAERQYQALGAALEQLSDDRVGRETPPPFQLPPAQAVDPRASYTLALWAYQQRRFDDVVRHCRRSIADSQTLETPFFSPVMLLSYLYFNGSLHQQKTAPGIAIVKTVEYLHWLNLSSRRSNDPHFQAETATAIWWTGILVGVQQDARSSALSTRIDLDGAINKLRRLVDTDALRPYEIARQHVRWTFAELSENRIRTVEVPRRRRARNPTSPSSIASLSDTQANNDFYGVLTGDFDYDPGSMDDGYNDPGAVQAEDVEKTKLVNKVNPMVAAPDHLHSYVPLDILALALQTKLTLKAPQVGRLAVHR